MGYPFSCYTEAIVYQVNEAGMNQYESISISSGLKQLSFSSEAEASLYKAIWKLLLLCIDHTGEGRELYIGLYP